jgi:hypothetical protein
MMQVKTMTLPVDSMSNPAPQPLEPVQIILVRKVILLALIMIVAALGLLLLLRRMQINTLFFPQIMCAAAMGLIAGISARWVLRNQTSFLRIASILVFLIGGLELLGWFTGWQVGLGPLKFGLSRVDWLSLGQLLLASGSSLLALYAWNQPGLDPNAPAPAPKPMPRSPRSRRWVGKRQRPTHRGAHNPSSLQDGPSSGQGQKAANQRKPQLQLSEEEEHRCPYCLELIEPNDPRGVVECKICHTLHHADCWAITGTCQVPHFTV